MEEFRSQRQTGSCKTIVSINIKVGIFLIALAISTYSCSVNKSMEIAVGAVNDFHT